MRESVIEHEVCKYASSTGWLNYKFVSPNNRGVPDRIFIKSGKVIFIEFKALGKKPTKLQSHTMEKLEKVGGVPTYVVDNVSQGCEIINHHNINNAI